MKKKKSYFMKKILKFTKFISLIVLVLLALPLVAQAITTVCDIVLLVENIRDYFSIIVGAMAVFMFLYAALMWMTAGGDEEKIGKAKQYLIYAAIGAIIFILAYSLTGILATWIGGNEIGGLTSC